MKRQTGFTLIELVVVIVILGILAATAAPKFMDLQSDARISALNGLAGATKSAITMTYSKAILSGKDKTASGAYICSTGAASAACTGTTTGAVAITYGKPAATAAGIIAAMDLGGTVDKFDASSPAGDWVYKEVTGTPKVIYISPVSQKSSLTDIKSETSIETLKASLCAVQYIEPTATATESVTVYSGGC